VNILASFEVKRGWKLARFKTQETYSYVTRITLPVAGAALANSRMYALVKPRFWHFILSGT